MASEQKSGLSRLADIADSFAKITVGLVSIGAALYLASADQARQCGTIVQSLYDVVKAKHYDPAAIDTIVGVSDPGNCNFVARGLPAALKAASLGIIGASAATVSLDLPKPSADKGNVPASKGEEAKASPLSGWVAVGFLDSSDLNFDLSNGTKATAVGKGTDLKAKTQVNVRPGAAVWGKTVGVLQPGECFKVSDVQALSAGKQQQTWAGGTRVSCPAK